MNKDLFNFYKRYIWTANDFANFQEAVQDLSRTADGGSFQGAVVKGMDVSPVSGMVLSVEPGVAISASGYALIKEASENVEVTAASANLKRSLLVIRPKLVLNTVITKPTSPFEQVFLKTTQDSELVVIDGTPSATPEYPSKESEDVVVCGLRLYNGQTTVTDDDIEWMDREIPGKNGEIHQRQSINDARLKPYRSAYNTVTIQPSQKLGKGQRAFSYGAKGSPSIYPKDSGGLFTNTDSILNFITGAITGGDDKSDDFTPTVPTSGNSITAVVLLTANDTIQVVYGTQGTRAQCLTAIKNQTFGTAAGNLPYAPMGYKLAYVVVTSISGSLADIEVMDIRGNHKSGHMTTSIANNQSSAVDVAGFPYFKTTDAIGIKFYFHILRRTDTQNFVESGHVFMQWNSETSSWYAPKMSSGDDSGIEFETATTGGSNEHKLRYTTDNKTGANYSGTLKISDIQIIIP